MTTQTTEPKPDIPTQEELDDSGDTTASPPVTGFEPPAEATKARYKRLNPQTGGWEDAPVIFDGYKTPVVDVEFASPNLPLSEQISTFHRITWYAANGRVCGYSKTWRLDTNLDTTGGHSNTPRMWPEERTQAHVSPQGGYLSSADTLALLRGLSMVVHEAAAPMLAQVHQYAEATLARERAFHEARLQAEQQRHLESLERDRAFMAAMRGVEEIPRERRLTAIEQHLADIDDDDHEQAEQAATPQSLNSYAVAQALVENAPEIIRTVAKEVRGYGADAAMLKEQ